MQTGTLTQRAGVWYGQWNTFISDPTTGEKKRRIKKVRLGKKSELGKLEAKDALRKEIERDAEGKPTDVRPDPKVTLKWFTDNRWLPTKEATWRPGSKSTAEYELGLIMDAFGETPLEELDKIDLQNWLNKLSDTKSEDRVKHCRSFLGAILEEAVEQDYLRKSPARALSLPRTRTVEKFVLTPEQFQDVLAKLDKKRSLMVRLLLFCALRPSEFFALRWSCFVEDEKVFYIRESVYQYKLRQFTKTTEDGDRPDRVAIPDVLVEELQVYREELKELLKGKDNHFIFESKRGTFIGPGNFLKRVLKDLKEKSGLPKLNFQVLRRSAATWAQKYGGVKDVQTHLRHKTPDVSFAEYVQPLPESTRAMVNTLYDKMKG